MTSPPAALLALDGRHLDSLTPAELAVFQRYRNGRPKDGRPWISVGLGTPLLDPSALLSAPTQAQADEILRNAGAVICVRVYD
ncbi:MAG TPA: hypothetical protein DC063_12435 [Arenimonas sp.]|nr:MAG: hypothetical protein A2X76_05185 [Xanthomonadales bacterium GWF1_69_6]HBD20800.1 hypothetical protein [Arenimonas sp.]